AAAKIGLVPTAEVAAALAARLARRPLPSLVLDPVLVAGSGDALGASRTAAALRALFPHAAPLAPPPPGAPARAGRRRDDVDGMLDAARALVDLGAGAVLVKGGPLPERAVDVLLVAGAVHRFDAARVAVGATHGTGCTLSAAIVAGLGGRRGVVPGARHRRGRQ